MIAIVGTPASAQTAARVAALPDTQIPAIAGVTDTLA